MDSRRRRSLACTHTPLRHVGAGNGRQWAELSAHGLEGERAGNMGAGGDGGGAPGVALSAACRVPPADHSRQGRPGTPAARQAAVPGAQAGGAEAHCRHHASMACAGLPTDSQAFRECVQERAEGLAMTHSSWARSAPVFSCGDSSSHVHGSPCLLPDPATTRSTQPPREQGARGTARNGARGASRKPPAGGPGTPGDRRHSPRRRRHPAFGPGRGGLAAGAAAIAYPAR